MGVLDLRSRTARSTALCYNRYMSLAARFFQSLCFFLSVASIGWAQTESTAYLIDTIAGSDLPLDADRAVDTWLNFPVGVATDDAGNVYVSDTFNHRVLRIKPDGTRETAAGSGTCGFPVDGGPAIFHDFVFLML